MEELGLSHILNAEGEKLQYILGMLEGTIAPEATIYHTVVTPGFPQYNNEVVLKLNANDEIRLQVFSSTGGPITLGKGDGASLLINRLS